MQERLLSIPDVALRLSMSERWVSAMCRSGKLKAVKLGKHWRISEENLEEFVKERSHGRAA